VVFEGIGRLELFSAMIIVVRVCSVVINSFYVLMSTGASVLVVLIVIISDVRVVLSAICSATALWKLISRSFICWLRN